MHKFIPKEIGKIITDIFDENVEEMIPEDFKNIHKDDGKHKRIVNEYCKKVNYLKPCFCIQNIIDIYYQTQGLEFCKIEENESKDGQSKILINSNGNDFVVVNLETDGQDGQKLNFKSRNPRRFRI